MIFNSTYELLVFLRKKDLLTSFTFEEYHKSSELTLDGDTLLPPDIHNEVHDILWSFCSRRMDGAFNFYGYDLLLKEGDKLQLYVEQHRNAYFAESPRLDDYVDMDEVRDIFSKYAGREIPEEEFEEDFGMRVDNLDLEEGPEKAINHIYISGFGPDSPNPLAGHKQKELKKELFDYLAGCFCDGEKNTISIEDGSLKYWYSRFETIDADYFDDGMEYEVPDEALPF